MRKKTAVKPLLLVQSSMESIAYVTALSAHVLVPAFFWVRGILRNQDSDMNLALVLVWVFGVLRFFTPNFWPIEPLNESGLIIFGMGVVLMVLGLKKKIDKAWKTILSSIVLMILGFFLFALM